MQKQKTKPIWKEVELGEVLDYEQPTKYIVESIDYKDEYKTPVLTAGKSFILGYTNETEGIYDKLPVIIFDDFTTENKFVDFRFKVKSSAMKLLAPKNELINLKYIFLVMQTINFDMERHKRYYLSAYQKIKILLPHTPEGKPDLETQKQIVAILEKAENLKQKQKRQLELYDEYLKSVFWKMFLSHRDDSKEPKDKWKWEEKSLSEVCDFIDYRGKTPKKTKSGIKLITAKNVKKGYIDNKPQEFIAESDYESWMTRGFPKKGDVLFTTEAPLGNVAVLGEFNKIALAQRIITLQTKEKLNPFYLMYFLLSPNFQNKLEKDTTGSTVTGIRAKEFKKISVPLPPLLLQQKFANIVEKVEKLKEKQKKNLADSEELFNVLMQRAFKGELR
jgi:type I restriction enzyme S subunit